MGTDLSTQFGNILEEFGLIGGIEDAYQDVTTGQPVL